MDNATRFLKAFNAIDHGLRVQYNFNRGMSFSDIIRRCVQINSVVRKYEDDLVDYGRLRNAIVHSGNEDEIIAQPNDNVVQKMERIAKLISTPPKAMESICRKDVLCVDANESVKSVIETIGTSGYSNLPVYKEDKLVGVANGQRILDVLGKVIKEKKNIDAFCKNTKIGDVVSAKVANTYYAISNKDITLEQALELFYRNRKMLAILITNNGIETEKPIGIISVADIMDINAILENY